MIVQSINRLIEEKGGICVVDEHGNDACLPLPVAGLMSLEKGEVVAEKYKFLDQKAKSLGSTLTSPFMTLSFMALLDRKSTRLNSSHVAISYAVFCLKKKKKMTSQYNMI